MSEAKAALHREFAFVQGAALGIIGVVLALLAINTWNTTLAASGKLTHGLGEHLLASSSPLTFEPSVALLAIAPALPAGSNTNCRSGVSGPTPATSVGYQHLVFCDDFNSPSTIDASGTGNSGFNWYTNWPFGWGHASASLYGVASSVLSVTGNGKTANWTLSTRDPKTRQGHAWTYAYFEARISFDPTLGRNSNGWPSFWSLSASHAQGSNADHWGELDFFEALTSSSGGGKAEYHGDFSGSIHDWLGHSKTAFTNNNNFHKLSTDWSKWHVVGCLWTPGKVSWYLDQQLVNSQSYSDFSAPYPSPHIHFETARPPRPTGAFSVLDHEQIGMEVILGSGPNWPMRVDWVRVWQR